MKTLLILLSWFVIIVSVQSCATTTKLQKKSQTTKSGVKKIQTKTITSTNARPDTTYYTIPILRPKYKDTIITLKNPLKPKYRARLYYKNNTIVGVDCINDNINKLIIQNQIITDNYTQLVNQMIKSKESTPPQLSGRTLLYIGLILLVLLIVNKLF